MRPARKGPENHQAGAEAVLDQHRFNEAGPQGAGKPRTGGGQMLQATPLQ